MKILKFGLFVFLLLLVVFGSIGLVCILAFQFADILRLIIIIVGCCGISAGLWMFYNFDITRK